MEEGQQQQQHGARFNKAIQELQRRQGLIEQVGGAPLCGRTAWAGSWLHSAFRPTFCEQGCMPLPYHTNSLSCRLTGSQEAYLHSLHQAQIVNGLHLGVGQHARQVRALGTSLSACIREQNRPTSHVTALAVCCAHACVLQIEMIESMRQRDAHPAATGGRERRTCYVDHFPGHVGRLMTHEPVSNGDPGPLLSGITYCSLDDGEEEEEAVQVGLNHQQDSWVLNALLRQQAHTPLPYL